MFLGEKDGLFLVGKLVEIGPVVYGSENAKVELRGTPVPNFYRAAIQVGSQPYPTTASFNEIDPETDEPAPIFAKLNNPDLVGKRIALKVMASGSRGGTFANLRAVQLVEVPDDIASYSGE